MTNEVVVRNDRDHSYNKVSKTTTHSKKNNNSNDIYR